MAKVYPHRRPAPPITCVHGVGRYARCQACIDIEAAADAAFAANIPDEMRVVDTMTGQSVTFGIPRGMQPTKRGARMGQRTTLRPNFGASDSRPRIELRLVEREGVPAIGFRSHPAAAEAFAPTIEMAMAAVLDDVADEAIIVWKGTRKI